MLPWRYSHDSVTFIRQVIQKICKDRTFSNRLLSCLFHAFIDKYFLKFNFSITQTADVILS